MCNVFVLHLVCYFKIWQILKTCQGICRGIKKRTMKFHQGSIKKRGGILALLHFRTPSIVIDDSSWKNAAECFTVALSLTLGGYESAIVPEFSGGKTQLLWVLVFDLGNSKELHRIFRGESMFSLEFLRLRVKWQI